MVVQNCSNIDNIRIYRLTWRYIEIHEIGTQITIPNFIITYTYPKMPYFQALSPFSYILTTQFTTQFLRLLLPFQLLLLSHLLLYQRTDS